MRLLVSGFFFYNITNIYAFFLLVMTLNIKMGIFWEMGQKYTINNRSFLHDFGDLSTIKKILINITLNCYYSGKHSLSRSIFSVSRVCFSLVPTFTLKKQTINILDKLDNHIFFLFRYACFDFCFLFRFIKVEQSDAHTHSLLLSKTLSGNVGSCKKCVCSCMRARVCMRNDQTSKSE